ncbi:Peptidyl-Lys metalloendopeptidase [Grifola frondosa]|uniref:Peptidyl-Lys metalloendopeptidase n=1 Tax=Grifola frondosa TaxID=5627 RepID=A0A1C7MR86_GRIFR|nr:Peptidyl-Lys metalloendopeptidase [Grifola frondosa]
MHSLSALLAFVASAVMVSATPGLLVQVTGPAAVHDIQNLQVVATVVNTGNESLKLLKDPHGPLSQSPTDIFNITNGSGDSPDFIGIRVYFAPSYSIEQGNPDSFTVLAPGESVGIQHDLSQAYNLTSTGSGQYTVAAKEGVSFYYVDPATNTSASLQADVGYPAHNVSVTGSLARTDLSKRELSARDYNYCSDDQKAALDIAIPAGVALVANANAAIQEDPNGNSPNFVRWFGQPDVPRRNHVAGNFQRMSGNVLADFTWNCEGQHCEPETGAYVYPTEYGTVYVCATYFGLPLTGRDSQASVIVHELSHYTVNGGAQDFKYGVPLCEELAVDLPIVAISNAASYQYYAADV